jgi:murein L,D-transpeptidase YcbB/YkuD
MDPLTILQLALKYGPIVKEIIDAAESNSTIVDRIKTLSSPLATLLEGIGSTLFPNAKSQLHVAAGAIAAFDPNVTKWVQSALNQLLTPSPNLVVDGIYGQMTKAAVTQLQTNLGLTADGWAGQLTQAAIATALAKLAPTP